VSVINGTTITATITGLDGPIGVAVAPVAGTVFVTNIGNNTVSVINGTTITATITLPAGSLPLAQHDPASAIGAGDGRGGTRRAAAHH